MIVLMLFVVGCQNMSETNSYCLDLKPITISEIDLNNLSDSTLREIDNFNQEYKASCE